MKVIVQYTETGIYKDHAWEASSLRIKGQLHAVTPSYAAQLIEQRKAQLHTDQNDSIVIVN
ncbi:MULTISPECIES: hypothetical protein [Aliivibrio]|jgi:hypothetical protein|uniref:C factor cell-cell signaling protein n=3 Tax=Aliivibrio TaxID=511678 RepID=A0A1B9P002_ALILO|nr:MULTISPECIES: hypothetical protein [Aliivibrio]AZL84700.1 hypothetical protein EIJ81_08805 [Aliivibrio salmonicida]MBB1315268.1 hypothetical protein [Aliivibrio sp. SR45-2]OCH21692.1 hypothetical protein A6E04_07450 [Aliivibrio logei]OEF12655.1 hypothetical protein A1Q5_09245 [Aliivibrio logei 5S-186]CAQ79090.1 hypothetical protein VSAL_I1405 [Aliivibrio salmonicida LFI1238]